MVYGRLMMRKDKINVLVVDDSQSMRYSVTTTLSSVGYSTDEACDGIEALNLAKDKVYDFVLTDINMPNMNGFQLIEALRDLQGYKFVPIVTLTTQTDKESRQKAKQAGATGWIVKPFTPDRLTEVMAKLTEAKVA
jgi:two-component system chemotaxis response regulator CheY